MGKPYGHQYFFAGNGSSTGDMICKQCNQPIFNHNQDWMSYQKSKSYDWSYHCFHRKCREDQTGWEKVERKNKEASHRAAIIRKEIMEVVKKHKLEGDDNIETVCNIASFLDADLHEWFFGIYGSS